VANGITTVHLAYVRNGRALIAARQWIPAEQTMTRPCPWPWTATAWPGTKGQLATDLLHRGVRRWRPGDFVCGDEVYALHQLRAFCEGRGQGYVLRVP
jgi:hypothetical protein